jgi:RNA polymerase sigma-70 factor (ECF subfamily)
MTDTRSSDRELWSQATGGDDSAFALLFDRHAGAVYNHCFRLTASWTEAQDATQVTFLAAWRRRASVQLVADSALPWLLTVATNTVRTQWRTARRWRAALRRLPPERDDGDLADEVAGRVDDERRMRQVLQAVRLLPKAERDALMLCGWSGVSYRDAAAVLNIAEASVRLRVSRARNRLAQALDAGDETCHRSNRRSGGTDVNTMVQPPAERDLPERRRLQMRAQLMRAIANDAAPAPQRSRRRYAIAGAALTAVAVAAVGVVAAVQRTPEQPLEYVAYTGGAMSARVRDLSERCLAEHKQLDKDARVTGHLTLLNMQARNGSAQFVYATQGWLATCSEGVSQAAGIFPDPDWLPGAMVLGLADWQDGPPSNLNVWGMVSPRVSRVVLEHGNGRTTEATLASGTFSIVNDGPVDVHHAVVVAYDRQGAVIARHQIMQWDNTCYTDPTGKVVFGKAESGNCQPAERWR